MHELAAYDEIVGTYFKHQPVFKSDAVRLYKVDVTEWASVIRFVEAIQGDARRITLVNLAGCSVDRLAINVTPHEWDAVVAVNLTGTFMMSKALLRPMMQERWGRIINVSSIIAETGVPGTAAYAASKAGIVGLTRTLAKEYARYNITVNCLALGYFAGGLTERLSEKHRKSLLARIPLRRFGKGAELAGAVKYLMEADYTTGARLDINGGLP